MENKATEANSGKESDQHSLFVLCTMLDALQKVSIQDSQDS
jgi:hypothetical protein